MKLEIIYIGQDYGASTRDDRGMRVTCCRRQLDLLRDKACRQSFDEKERIALDLTRVPHLGHFNGRLCPITGWSARAVPGYFAPRSRVFLRHLAAAKEAEDRNPVAQGMP